MKLSDPIAEMIIPPDVTPAEIDWAESQHKILNPDHAPRLLSVFDGDGIEALQPTELAALEEQSIIAAGWHEARGRLELSNEFRVVAIRCQTARNAKENSK